MLGIHTYVTLTTITTTKKVIKIPRESEQWLPLEGRQQYRMRKMQQYCLHGFMDEHFVVDSSIYIRKYFPKY